MLDKLKFMSPGQLHDHSHSIKEEVEEDLFPEAVSALIFDAISLDEIVPRGFNAVRVPLDASLKSDLRWKRELEAAQNYIRQGLRIFWDIQLGLFSQEEAHENRSQPIDNQSRFLSLSLALEHFRDSVWKEFRQHTVGLCLYRGSANFTTGFVWSEEQILNLQEWLKGLFIDPRRFVSETSCEVSDFKEIKLQSLINTIEGKRLVAIYCRNVIGKYLGLLSDRLPDTLQCYVLLDIQGISDPLLQVQMAIKEGFAGINLGIKGPIFNENAIAWDGPSVQLGVIAREIISREGAEFVKVGVCLPPLLNYYPSQWKKLEKALAYLKEKCIPFRIIPEASLTTEWDGLDLIIASLDNMSAEGMRKLQGFRAAGGEVVAAGCEIP